MPKVQDSILEQAKVEERFWAKVDKTPACWNWIGATTGLGYGNLRWKGRNAKAHRVAYELLVGPIPQGLTIDHLCRNRACVNPAHMESVTMRDNTLRGQTVTAANAKKTHCPNNHPYDLLNTWIAKDGSRHCRACALQPYRSQAAPRL